MGAAGERGGSVRDRIPAGPQGAGGWGRAYQPSPVTGFRGVSCSAGCGFTWRGAAVKPSTRSAAVAGEADSQLSLGVGVAGGDAALEGREHGRGARSLRALGNDRSADDGALDTG